ncbi:hypothetical protein DSM25558_0748 [Agrobacterium sp. DSM 25558]|nr:hypothetical protein DSM25558_0748 [Agrobacterium sp. DSM 25558]
MLIVRDLIQTVMMCKTRGRQPASLQVHGDIPTIMGYLEVIDMIEQRYLASAKTEVIPRLVSVEIDTAARRKRLFYEYL